MKTACPHCGQRFDVEEPDLGKEADCPNCGKRFVLQALSESSEPAQDKPAVRCPYCGGEISPDAKKCRHCGEWIDRAKKPKSPVIFVLLAVFLGRWGIHNFYAGANAKGISKLIIEAVVAIPCLGFWANYLLLRCNFYRASQIVFTLSGFVTLFLLLVLWARSYRLSDGKFLRMTFVSICALLKLAAVVAIALSEKTEYIFSISGSANGLYIPVSLFLTVDVWCVWEMFHCKKECHCAE